MVFCMADSILVVLTRIIKFKEKEEKKIRSLRIKDFSKFIYSNNVCREAPGKASGLAITYVDKRDIYYV